MNTNDAAVALATRGWGISRLSSYQIAPDIGLARLVRVLERFELPAIPIHVVHKEGWMASPKVSACVDLLVDSLRAEPAIN